MRKGGEGVTLRLGGSFLFLVEQWMFSSKRVTSAAVLWEDRGLSFCNAASEFASTLCGRAVPSRGGSEEEVWGALSEEKRGWKWKGYSCFSALSCCSAGPVCPVPFAHTLTHRSTHCNVFLPDTRMKESLFSGCYLVGLITTPQFW